MTSITIHDLLQCASHTLVHRDDIPPPVLNTSISESELMCGERIVPEYPVAEPALPTVVHVPNSLLAFETNGTTPLCLKPPTKDCRKRPRVEEEHDIAPAHNESMTSSTKASRRGEDWLSWINWDQMA